MTASRKIGLIAAVLFTVVNVGGLIYAMVFRELGHGLVHVALLAGTYVVWRLVARSAGDAASDRVQLERERLEYLQQSVDALAIEVERIGEAQRYAAKLQKERETRPPAPSEPETR